MLLSKRCPKCGETKDVAAFYVDQRTKDGRRCWCKECDAAPQKKRRATPARRAMKVLSASKRRAKKGGYAPINMSHEELVAFQATHDDTCDICKIHVDDCTQRLAVDHCHECGTVLGMLCGPCNRFREHLMRLLRHHGVSLTYGEHNCGQTNETLRP
jgi:hypothetical protein